MGVPEEWPSPERGQNPAYRPSDPAFSVNRGRGVPSERDSGRETLACLKQTRLTQARFLRDSAEILAETRGGPTLFHKSARGSPRGAIKIVESVGLLETNTYRSSAKKTITRPRFIGRLPARDSAGRISKPQGLAVSIPSLTIGMGSKPLRFLADSILSRLRPGYSHVIPYRPDSLRLGRGAPAAGRRGRGPWRSGPKS